MGCHFDHRCNTGHVLWIPYAASHSGRGRQCLRRHLLCGSLCAEHILKSQPEASCDRADCDKRIARYGNFDPAVRGILADDRRDLRTTFWSGAYRLLCRQQTEVQGANVLFPSEQAWNPDACNSCMGTWLADKLCSISIVSDLPTSTT